MLQTTQKNESILLSDHCLLSLTGADAVKLLQGQLTADVQALLPGQGQLAAHCQAQGRVISLFVLFRTNDGFILCLPQSMETLATTALRKYAIFYKTDIKPVTHYVVTAHTQTPTTEKTIAKAVLPNGTTYLLHETRPTDSTDTLTDYYHHLITHHIPCILPETSGEFLPHDLNLLTLGAVSLNKGCYTGQEIIARMEYKGTLKKQCHTARVNEAVKINDTIFLQGKARAVGRIINVATLDSKTYTVLMSLDNSALNNPLTTTQQTPYHLLTENERSHD